MKIHMSYIDRQGIHWVNVSKMHNIISSFLLTAWILTYIEVEGNAYFLSFKNKSNDDVMILRSVA